MFASGTAYCIQHPAPHDFPSRVPPSDQTAESCDLSSLSVFCTFLRLRAKHETCGCFFSVCLAREKLTIGSELHVNKRKKTCPETQHLNLRTSLIWSHMRGGTDWPGVIYLMASPVSNQKGHHLKREPYKQRRRLIFILNYDSSVGQSLRFQELHFLLFCVNPATQGSNAA